MLLGIFAFARENILDVNNPFVTSLEYSMEGNSVQNEATITVASIGLMTQPGLLS